MIVTAAQVKELRVNTGAGMMDCKKALTETGGDFEKAVEQLRKAGLAATNKKAGRIATEGLVGSYIHGNGKIGVMVEINCETDFVARNEDFQQFVKDVAMHVAAMNPQFLDRDSVPTDTVTRRRKSSARKSQTKVSQRISLKKSSKAESASSLLKLSHGTSVR